MPVSDVPTAPPPQLLADRNSKMPPHAGASLDSDLCSQPAVLAAAPLATALGDADAREALAAEFVKSCRSALDHQGFQLVRHDTARLRFHALEEPLQGRQLAELHGLVEILVQHGEPFRSGLLSRLALLLGGRCGARWSLREKHVVLFAIDFHEASAGLERWWQAGGVGEGCDEVTAVCGCLGV